ncbi:extracellular solute-binding protein [Paraoerskovia marina]|nr:extracellular solute-binding protein [Paraoerskovia marina]
MIRNSPTRVRVGAISAVAALALGLSACGSESDSSAATTSDPDEVTGDITLLTPIFEGTEGQKLLEDELLPQFYEEYPNVSVSVDYTTYGNLNEKLTTAAVSGAVPDVMLMGVGWIEGFADRGLIADLSELGLTEEKLLESYTPAIVDAGTWNDGVYAVPIMLDTRFGVARMDLLEEAGYDSPPQNWDELVEMSKALTVRDSDGTLERAGFDMLSLDSRQAFETMLFSAGGDLFNEDDTAPTFNEDPGVDALQLMSDLINVHEVEEIGFSSPDAAVNPLLNGRAAMGIAHNNLWTQGLEAAPEVLDDLEPFVIQGEGEGMFFGGTLATRSATSQSPEAAQAFLEFLASPGPALAANEQRGNVPALSELLDSEYVQSNGFVQFAMENLDVAKREGGPAEWLEVRGDFAPAVEATLLDQMSAEDSLNDLAGLVQTAIDR